MVEIVGLISENVIGRIAELEASVEKARTSADYWRREAMRLGWMDDAADGDEK